MGNNTRNNPSRATRCSITHSTGRVGLFRLRARQTPWSCGSCLRSTYPALHLHCILDPETGARGERNPFCPWTFRNSDLAVLGTQANGALFLTGLGHLDARTKYFVRSISGAEIDLA